MSGPTGSAGAAGRAQNAAGAANGGAGGAGRDAGSTSVMPAVGADSGPQAPRRRQGGPNGEQAQARAAAEAATPAAPATAPATSGGGYSTPTTYAKGQPTPPRGTPVPGAAADRAPGGANRPAAGRPSPAAPPSGRTRRARLRVVRTDPWTVMKVSFLLSIALGVVTIVGVSLLWMVLDAAGVFSSLGGTLKQATTGADASSGFDLQSYLSFGNVFMFTLLIAVIDVVLLTALCTLGSFIYNTAAGMTGGVELTLAEED
ncbi:DUF3566 domain-containing protein [Streptacidiphilus rugosus]|uniref:DUF3566 domain-containing protein n=1 Tax=Streptacidiphilus rugosus TaxID=405783 RepID=UPI00056873EA|nr:DUF3566 domain-containing protein [Streptacidiphilus rugosus]